MPRSTAVGQKIPSQTGRLRTVIWRELFTRERLIVFSFFTPLVVMLWVAIVYASVGLSWGEQLSHHALLGAKAQPLTTAVPIFTAAWVVMSAAMMLPTVWPVLDRFTHASRLQPLGRFLLLMSLFTAGYLAVWGAFGLVAFGGDVGLHWLVETLEPPGGLEEFIGAGVLLLAGVYQFSPLKWACLSQCQSPMSFLLRYWRPGLRGALALGLRHGLFCLGCCWALMLLMFVVGVTNLAWMLGLAILFYLEKVSARGMTLSRVLGALLLAGALLILFGFLPSPS